MSTIFTVDLETMASGGPDGRSPEAHWPINKVLWWGHRQGTATTVTSKKCKKLKVALLNASRDGHVIIIGHNLKFDLKYMIREMPDIPWHRFSYACTMHREYRITGHNAKFSSLENTAANYGISFTKGLDLGALIKSGVKMEDIPDSDLEPYLVEDVLATSTIYVRQEMLGAPKSEHVLPLAHMELLGMEVHKTDASALMTSLVTTTDRLRVGLLNVCQAWLQNDDGTPVDLANIKYNAPRTISYMLTGKPEGGFKLGKNQVVLKNRCILKPKYIQDHFGTAKHSNLGYPVPEKVLSKLAEGINLGYIQYILDYRKANKLMNTYIGPMLEKTGPGMGTSAIHPKMHITSTDTGRCSSADPNGQNFPDRARECIVTRHNHIHEIDFKQLEVVVLALLSKDPVLIRDIHLGKDLHYETGKNVFGWKTESDMTEKDRKTVKGVNFGLIYGGGPAGIAAQTGAPIKVVKQLIKAFYARYNRVGDWQEEFYTEVTKSMKVAGHENGEQVYDSMITLPLSNRKFHFKEKLSPIWLKKKTGRSFSFKPTETKNYPVQGFAGGDLVMDALRMLYDEFKGAGITHTDIIMTVHDSILVDSVYASLSISTIMQKVCTKLEKKYKMPFELKFDIKSGTHWG